MNVSRYLKLVHSIDETELRLFLGLWNSSGSSGQSSARVTVALKKIFLRRQLQTSDRLWYDKITGREPQKRNLWSLHASFPTVSMRPNRWHGRLLKTNWICPYAKYLDRTDMSVEYWSRSLKPSNVPEAPCISNILQWCMQCCCCHPTCMVFYLTSKLIRAS